MFCIETGRHDRYTQNNSLIIDLSENEGMDCEADNILGLK
jgi:hypothetical protein